METQPIRNGEEIDAGALRDFLRSELGLDSNEIDVEQFPAGSSNLTYLVRIGATEYVLRRPPFGNTVKTAHDMAREFNVLTKLSTVYLPAPQPLIYSGDTSIIGSEFYLMERRHGVIIRGRVPDNAGDAIHRLQSSQEFRRSVCRGFIANLASLHALDPRDAHLEDLGRPDGYNRRQIEGWTRRYFAGRTHDVHELEEAITWLHDHIPAESRACLIHNDYKFDNIMLDPGDLTRITAVLDWEMVTIGDPLMDLGTTLGYWMSRDATDDILNMPFNPRVLMENVTRQELVEMYSGTIGQKLPDLLFYYIFGTFKIAVIAQQIYARYVKGFTTDPRFSRFDGFVRQLGRIAARAISKGSI
ncbi:MAG: phosphotransferase family protein [Pyrinomonadaceae bacterium]